jgi:hypothetical protein
MHNRRLKYSSIPHLLPCIAKVLGVGQSDKTVDSKFDNAKVMEACAVLAVFQRSGCGV